MTDFIASDDDGRWDADREQRSWENHGIVWPDAKDGPDTAATYRQRTTATASWQRSVLIIATLSALSWAAVILIVIAALSAL